MEMEKMIEIKKWIYDPYTDRRIDGGEGFTALNTYDTLKAYIRGQIIGLKQRETIDYTHIMCEDDYKAKLDSRYAICLATITELGGYETQYWVREVQ